MHFINPRSNIRRLHRASWFSLLIASLAYGQLTQSPNPAVEDERPAQASKLSADDSVLTLPPFEITTARRKEENVQQVPISVTALGQQTLQNSNLMVLQDIAQMVPSMTVNSANTGIREQSSVTIRGQGVANISGLPAVGLYLNEVPIQANFDGSLAGGPGLYFDLESIDVLKGPQGTLFGLNTIGGAVLMQTARPRDNFSGNIQVTYGNYSNREVNGMLNMPILPGKLLLRVAFNKQVRRGFSWVLSSPNHPEGFDADNRDWEGARFTLTFRPVERFENDFILTRSHYRSNGTASFLTQLEAPATDFFPSMASEFAQQQALGARTHVPIDTDTDATEGDFTGLQNVTRVTINDDLVIKNIFGLHEGFNVETADVDGTDSGLFSLLPRKNKTRQITEEIQLLGKNFEGTLDWTAGFFYLRAAPPDNYYAYQAIRILFPDVLPLQETFRRETSTSKGYFLHGTYALSNLKKGLKLNAGVRYSTDDRLATYSTTANPATQPAGTFQSSAAWTGTVGLDYQFASDKLLYVAARRGYRAGGTNAATGTPPILYPYKPEYLDDLEVGFKMDWKLGAVPIRSNVAFYIDDYNNMQVTEQIPNPVPNQVPILNLTTNAAKARVQGAEVELLARVSKNLELTANYSYLSFKYKEFGSGVDSAALLATVRANRVPHKYGVGAKYFLPIRSENGLMVFNWNYNWTDACADFLGTSEIPAYGVQNLSLNWDGAYGKPIDVSLFCSNVANKTYYNGGIGFLGFWEKTYGEPRMYGIRARYRF